MSGTSKKTQLVSLRLSHASIEELRKRAEEAGVGWQTYLKTHIYEWLGLNVESIAPGTVVKGSEVPVSTVPPPELNGQLKRLPKPTPKPPAPKTFNPLAALDRLKGLSEGKAQK